MSSGRDPATDGDEEGPIRPVSLNDINCFRDLGLGFWIGWLMGATLSLFGVFRYYSAIPRSPEINWRYFRMPLFNLRQLDFRRGTKFGLWIGGYGFILCLLGKLRGKDDFLNMLLAGVSIGWVVQRARRPSLAKFRKALRIGSFCTLLNIEMPNFYFLSIDRLSTWGENFREFGVNGGQLLYDVTYDKMDRYEKAFTDYGRYFTRNLHSGPRVTLPPEDPKDKRPE